jgi:hypothetical protein
MSPLYTKTELTLQEGTIYTVFLLYEVLIIRIKDKFFILDVTEDHQ